MRPHPVAYASTLSLNTPTPENMAIVCLDMQEATRRVQWRYAGAFFTIKNRPLGEQLRIFALLMHAFRETCHNERKRNHFVLPLKCHVAMLKSN